MRMNASQRLLAFDLGDAIPKGWTQGDSDVTFTPFCKIVRSLLRHVSGIRAGREQEKLLVYVPEIKGRDLEKLNQELKRANIPGNPRFVSIALTEVAAYKGDLVIKYQLY